jgi:hypothetical protein
VADIALKFGVIKKRVEPGAVCTHEIWELAQKKG